MGGGGGYVPYRQFLVENKRKLPYLLGGVRYKRRHGQFYDDDDEDSLELLEDTHKRALDYLYGGVRYRRAL